VIVQLVREATRRALSDLDVQTRTRPEGIEGTHAEMASVRRWLEKLDDDTDGREATRWLLAWLLDRRRED
jgi:hypothetical protein